MVRTRRNNYKSNNANESRSEYESDNESLTSVNSEDEFKPMTTRSAAKTLDKLSKNSSYGELVFSRGSTFTGNVAPDVTDSLMKQETYTQVIERKTNECVKSLMSKMNEAMARGEYQGKISLWFTMHSIIDNPSHDNFIVQQVVSRLRREMDTKRFYGKYFCNTDNQFEWHIYMPLYTPSNNDTTMQKVKTFVQYGVAVPAMFTFIMYYIVQFLNLNYNY